MGKKFFDIHKSTDEPVSGRRGRESADSGRTEAPGKRTPSVKAQINAETAHETNNATAQIPAVRQAASPAARQSQSPANTAPRVVKPLFSTQSAANQAGYDIKLRDFLKGVRNAVDSYSNRYTENYDNVYHPDAADYAAGFQDAQGRLNRTAASLLSNIEALRGENGDAWALSAASDVAGRVKTVNGMADFVKEDADSWLRFQDETDYSAAMFGARPARRYGSTYEAAQRAMEEGRTLSADTNLLETQSLLDYDRSKAFVDPGLLAAQQSQEDRQNITVSVDPALAEAQREYEKRLHRGFADPGLAAAMIDDEKRNRNVFRINPEQLVEIAKTQVGYTEKDNHTYINDDVTDTSHAGTGNYTKYGAFTGNNGAAWCASFISWLINEDNPYSSFETSASTGYIMGEYEEEGYFQENDHETPPHAGDIVIFAKPDLVDPSLADDPNSHYHIGIVAAYDPDTRMVYTIEGNTGGQKVEYRAYCLDDIYDPDANDEYDKFMRGFCHNGSTSYGIVTDEMRNATGT